MSALVHVADPREDGMAFCGAWPDGKDAELRDHYGDATCLDCFKEMLRQARNVEWTDAFRETCERVGCDEDTTALVYIDDAGWRSVCDRHAHEATETL